mmetsp:Transcript_12327/g.22375  ORF Transcript_12327/g.22375 Transcript_12327/m.22375 type:complete len:96 (-) Transcript_12327:554-841(-)
MSVAILIVNYGARSRALRLDLKGFSLSAPQSVKDHITKQMKEHFGGTNERWTWADTYCTVSHVPIYLLVSWVERNFGKLEHVSSCEDSTTYVFHR